MEVRFSLNGKWNFAIGFPNASGGYEVRNKYFKGCIAPKDITHIRQTGEPKETCYVFEGFMDDRKIVLIIPTSTSRTILF